MKGPTIGVVGINYCDSSKVNIAGIIVFNYRGEARVIARQGWTPGRKSRAPKNVPENSTAAVISHCGSFNRKGYAQVQAGAPLHKPLQHWLLLPQF